MIEEERADVKQSIVRLKNLMRDLYPYRDYPEVDADMAEIQKEIAQLNRALDRIEAQLTKEVA